MNWIEIKFWQDYFHSVKMSEVILWKWHDSNVMSCGAQLIDLNGTCLESQGNVRNREFNSFQVEYGIEKRFVPFLPHNLRNINFIFQINLKHNKIILLLLQQKKLYKVTMSKKPFARILNRQSMFGWVRYAKMLLCKRIRDFLNIEDFIGRTVGWSLIWNKTLGFCGIIQKTILI